MTIENKIQLITYPDSLGPSLPELHYVLRKYFRRAVHGVHILPFYPSSSDRGFAPLTYDEVDPNFGTWEDVDRIGRDFDLVVDFMVNHISRQSIFFQDYLHKGQASEYADMFISFNKLAPNGWVRDEDLDLVYTRKPRPPYQIIERPNDVLEKVWCTFDYEQIDLDYTAKKTREVMGRFLIRLARRNLKMIRLDAVAYTTMELGTNCFFLEPQIWELLDWFSDIAKAFDVEILPEVHEHYNYQLKLSEKGYWCYDFSLPMLVLHALYMKTANRLKNWLRICPRKQITTLDTHDGIGVVDVMDLLTQREIDRTLELLYEKGSNVKKTYSGPEYQNLDIYQVNCTYYSALGCSDDAYIAARCIQFFAPGHPPDLLCGPPGRGQRHRIFGKNPHGSGHQPPQLSPGRGGPGRCPACGPAPHPPHGIPQRLPRLQRGVRHPPLPRRGTYPPLAPGQLRNPGPHQRGHPQGHHLLHRSLCRPPGGIHRLNTRKGVPDRGLMPEPSTPNGNPLKFGKKSPH